MCDHPPMPPAQKHLPNPELRLRPESPDALDLWGQIAAALEADAGFAAQLVALADQGRLLAVGVDLGRFGLQITARPHADLLELLGGRHAG